MKINILASLLLLLLSCTGRETDKQVTDSADTQDGQTDDLDHEARLEVLESVYGSLATFVNASSPDLAEADQLSLSVREAVTVGPELLEDSLWLDRVDMYSGEMIEVSRDETYDRPTDSSTMSYQAEWVAANPEEDFLDSTDGQLLPGATVGEILNLIAEELPEYERADEVTYYLVSASFQGQIREYNAIALWMPGESEEASIMLIGDFIVSGLKDAAIEELEVGIECSTEEDRMPVSDSHTPECVEETVPVVHTNEDEDFLSHLLWGSHSMSVEATSTCSCSSSCVSKCEAEWNERSCNEVGGDQTTACHSRRSKSLTTQDTSDDGHLNPASCSVAYICAVKPCLFCICGLTIGLEKKDTGGISVSGDPDAIWEGTLNENRECGACAEVPDPIDQGDYEGTMTFNVDYIDYMDMTPETHACSLDIELDVDSDGNVEGEFLCDVDTINMIDRVKVEFIGTTIIEFTVQGASGELVSDQVGWAVPITTELGASGDFAISLVLSMPHGSDQGGAVAIDGSFNVQKVESQ